MAHLKKFKKNFVFVCLDSGSGSLGKAVASYNKDSQFDTSHRQILSTIVLTTASKRQR